MDSPRIYRGTDSEGEKVWLVDWHGDFKALDMEAFLALPAARVEAEFGPLTEMRLVHASPASSEEGVVSKDQLNRIVAGELRNTIDAHGPITTKWISSAAKRIAGQLLAALPSRGTPEADALRGALLGVARSHPDGRACWCEHGIGNPMVSSHSAACDLAWSLSRTPATQNQGED